jgi:hypothetical protein
MEPTLRRSFFGQQAEAEGFLAHGFQRGVGEGEVAVLSEKTEKGQISTVVIAFLFSFSIVGLAFVPVWVMQPNVAHSQLFGGHSLIGVLYATICLLGVAAVFYPARCRGVFQKTQNPLPQKNTSFAPLRTKGHHPDCRNFSGNRIIIKGKVFCAACSGLLAGAMIALVGTALHFFVGKNMAMGSVWMVALGEVWMLLGLAQTQFAGYVKVIANTIFVSGSFIVLVEADMLGGNVLLDLYVLGIIGFMLWFRILLSEWNNRRICNLCESCFQ